MKRIITLSIVLLFITAMSAQTPQKMSYQAVIRNASNALVANTVVGMKISILQTTVSGAVVYEETHAVTTNVNGLATLEIGNGSVVSGSFSAINWAIGPYFVKTETDPAGGTNYTITATSQLLSVPYALLAERAVQPTYPVSTSVNSTTFLGETTRNQWIDDPNINLVVPETGKYLLTFYGTAFNNNQYFGTDPAYDSDGSVRVYNSINATELLNMIALRQYDDLYTPSYALHKTMPMRPTRSLIVNLNGGDQLKIQYEQTSLSSSFPTTTWYIGSGGISILKIGE